MSLEEDPQTFLFDFCKWDWEKTDQTSFDTDATDSQFVRLRYPTEFLDPDIGPSSVGNPTSGAWEILNPTRPSSNHWLWQLDQTMMRHVQKPVSNVDYIPLEVQFYMGRMDLMTGSQINKCQTLQSWLCTLFTSPIYPSIWCWAPASGPKNEYDAGSKRCLAAWLEWGDHMRRTTMVTPRPDLRSQKSYPLRWCEGSQKWCLRQPRTKTIDILWHFAGSIQWEWTVFNKNHQHIYQNHWKFAGFVHSQSAKTPTVHFRSSNLSRMSESPRYLTTLWEDCGWMEGYDAWWGNMKMGCHSKAQQT
jgi:hypothetical protein